MWPLTDAGDGCGYHARPAGSGTQGKIADAEILEIVRSLTLKPAIPLKRAWLIGELKERGLARSSAIERVERLVRDRILIQGLVRPPTLARWNFNHPAVWLPSSPPDGAGGDPKEAVRPQAGRPAYEPEHFIEAIRLVAPRMDKAGRRSDILRAMQKVVPKIGASTADRIIGAMLDRGMLKTIDGIFWVSPLPVPSTPSTP